MIKSDPFKEAAAIRRGERDDEIPQYDVLTGWLQRIPATWLPDLLRRIVSLCVARKVFQEGGLEILVARAMTEGEDLSAAVLRQK